MLAIITVLLNFIAGSFLIVFGVNALGRTLERAGSALLDKVMRAFTRNRWTAFLVGTFTTAMVQSSTAVTLLTIGFVDSGLMTLESAVAVIFGANIGTTITAQLMSFSLTEYAYYILIAGSVFALGLVPKLETAGRALASVGLMFSGLHILGQSIRLIQNSPAVSAWLTEHAASVPLCLLFGIVVTMLVQSSSATVGMTILLFGSGLMPFESAVALTLGDNIGTCMTAQIASIRLGLPGRRTAWAHTLYNVIGAAIALALLPQFCALVEWFTQALGQDEDRLVANTHTLFNVLSAVVFLPLTGLYARFIEWIVPGRQSAAVRRLGPRRAA
ncbi:MAG: Na/Pi cotransporter family protein [Christensenellales bacterium]|jgi:phosphate:Na+ symporter